MKNPKVQFAVFIVLVIAAGLLLIPSLTQAKPKVDPWQDAEDQRDGYSRSFIVDANSVLLEVPQERRYVLLRLVVRTIDFAEPWFEYWQEMGSYWTLTLEGDLFLDEYSLNKIYYGDGYSVYNRDYVREDFPDQCVVVNGGQTLAVSMPAEVERINITLIGYFCDAP